MAAILGEDRVIHTDNGIAPTGRGGAPAAETGAVNPGTVHSALVDMALLSRCDDLVVTLASSFGWVAAAWGGLAPVQMVFGAHASSQNPYWYRALNSEPCFWEARVFVRALDGAAAARFRGNPFWMQYTQCHHDWEH